MARKKKNQSYHAAIIESDLKQLGLDIAEFRSVRFQMMEDGIDPRAVEIFDDMYQQLFNTVLCSLYNCLEMGLDEEVMKGLRNMMYIGYKKGINNAASSQEPPKKGP